MKKKVIIGIMCCVLAIIMTGLLASCSESSNSDSPKTGEDYESAVWRVFWEAASEQFGVEYSDYKMTQTSCSYICDNEMSNGYVSHYYLIQTAFEKANSLGQTVLHNVTARCYYAPEYKNTVYIVYVTLDGETVCYEEETEDWLLGISEVPN